MQPTCTRQFVLVCALLLACPIAGAATYKWTDADGKVHYSDQPPPASVKDPGTVTKPRASRSTPTPQTDSKPAAAPTAKTPQELDAEFRQRQVQAAEKEAEQKKKLAETEDKKKNCEQARANVERLESGGRSSRYNDKGEIEYLNDDQIAQELARVRKVADSWCK